MSKPKGSKHNLETCKRYAEHLNATGQGVKNPGGYAVTIHRSGVADADIDAFLSPDRQHGGINSFIELLANAYPQSSIGKHTEEIYQRMLSDIPPDVLKAATLQHIATSKYFPSIAELREIAFALSSEVSQMPTPFEAWEEVVSQIRRTGFYGKPVFSNKLIARAVDCLDWQVLCSSENSIADRAHFVRVYEQLLEREVNESKMLPEAREVRELLAGIAEQKQIH